MCGEFHNRTGIGVLTLIRPTQDQPFQQAAQGSNSMDDLPNLAQVEAELSYLNRLEAKREINVASLKRLKEACDALLLREQGEVAGTGLGQVLRFVRNDG
jgi:hypothetical protein